MVRIILIRHGETNWNLQGRYQGQEDTRLSEKGFAQAGLLAQGLKNVHLDLCISSPLKRSFLTCKACADLHHLPVHSDKRLTEINHGAWEGELACEIQAHYPEEFKKWHTEPHKVQMPGGEIWKMYVGAPVPLLTNTQKNTKAKQFLLPRMTPSTKPLSATCWGLI